MIFVAQIDPATGSLKQGMGFSTPALAESHMGANPEFNYVTTGSFCSPSTHQYINGKIEPKPQE